MSRKTTSTSEVIMDMLLNPKFCTLCRMWLEVEWWMCCILGVKIGNVPVGNLHAFL